ncbi:MAG: hypothetical protein U0W24_01145 [Bacteroidales bacterium]
MKPSKKAEIKKNKIQAAKSKDLLEITDNFLTKKLDTWFWVFFGISVLFTILLFDLRVSVGGDDSEYIIRADNLVKDFKYPSFQGPLYPMILAIFIGIFGIKLWILKLLSAIFLTAHLYLIYRCFKNKIPSIVLIGTILLISINSFLLFYGSQTYSEAFFLMVQILFFAFFFKYYLIPESSLPLAKEWPRYIALGAIILALGLIKTIGYASFFAVILFFAFEKRWKSAIFATAGFSVSFGLWQLVKYLVWHDKKAQFSDQAVSLLQKHPYDASQGVETFGGFIQRVIDNSNIYISRQLFEIFGLRPELVQVDDALVAPPVMPTLTLLVYILFFIGLFRSLRTNKYLFFTGIYLFIMTGITFLSLQTLWESKRLIMSVFPFMVMFLIAGIYYFFSIKKLKEFQFIVPLVLVILFFSTINTSMDKIKEHQKVFKEHLKGNITAGMTPDWVNFIKMSKWAAENIPQDKVIASRKPSISFIYTGRRFYGIYKVDSTDPDTLLNYLHEQKVQYVIMASLRKVEARKTEYIINTIQRYLGFIQQKYPDKIKLVHQIGTPEDEPAYLFKIE